MTVSVLRMLLQLFLFLFVCVFVCWLFRFSFLLFWFALAVFFWFRVYFVRRIRKWGFAWRRWRRCRGRCRWETWTRRRRWMWSWSPGSFCSGPIHCILSAVDDNFSPCSIGSDRGDDWTNQIVAQVLGTQATDVAVQLKTTAKYNSWYFVLLLQQVTGDWLMM